jgi:hypothetical protein
MTNANTVDTLGLIWSAGFLLGLVYVIRGIIRARRRTARTTGTVVRVEIRGSRVIGPSPDVEFVDGQGNKHLFKSGYTTSWNRWPVGSQADVAYDPHDPTDCEIALPRIIIVILAIVAIPLASLGVFLVARHLYDAWQSIWG